MSQGETGNARSLSAQNDFCLREILTLSSFSTLKWEGETLSPLEAGDLCAGQQVNITEQNRAFALPAPELSWRGFDSFFLEVIDSVTRVYSMFSA